MSASAWTLVGFGAGFAIRLVGNVALARLLFPEAFGLMQLVGVVLTGLQMFSDIGVGAAIIQSPRGDDRRFLNTAWTMQVFRGVALWGCAAVLAPVAARFYDEPRLLPLVLVAGSTCVLGGLNSTAVFAQSRHLSLRAVTFLEIGSSLAGYTIMIAWAAVVPSVWALVVGSIVTAAAKAIGSHVLLPGPRNRFFWEKDAARELYRFGRWVFVNTIIAFIATQADRALLGKLVSLHILGVYGIAATLVQMLRGMIASLAGNVLFPAVSKYVHFPRSELRTKVAKYRWGVLLAGACAVSVLVVSADVVVRLLYDQRYQAAGWMLSLLAAGLWPTIVTATSEMCLWALGKTGAVALNSGLRVVALCVLVPIGYWRWGLPGLVLAVSLIEWARYLGAAVALARERISFIRQDAIATFAMLAVLAGLLAARFAAGWGSPVDQIWRTDMLAGMGAP